MGEKKDNNKIVLILIGIVLIAVSFGCGYYISNMNNKKNVNENASTKKEENLVDSNETQEEVIKVTDQYAINTYGDVLRYYIISNGRVYYKISKDNFAGLNVCPNDKEYCKHNSTFNNDVTEISEISDAKKIKMVSDIHASGERFIYFVIAENKVYQFYETMDMDMNYTGVKVSLIEELSNKDIVDLVNYTNDKYIFVTSDNKQIDY